MMKFMRSARREISCYIKGGAARRQKEPSRKLLRIANKIIEIIFTTAFIPDNSIMLACVCDAGVKFKSNDNNKCGGYKR